jgi:hypothetical protein
LRRRRRQSYRAFRLWRRADSLVWSAKNRIPRTAREKPCGIAGFGPDSLQGEDDFAENIPQKAHTVSMSRSAANSEFIP